MQRARPQRRTWSWIRAACGGLLAVLVCACASVPDEPRLSLQARVRDVLSAFETLRDFSGVTLITESDGMTLVGDARGLADHELNVPVTLSTRFQIASISKLFVNVAVLREVERGGLALEAPIGRYVPNLPPRLAKATIAELMLHTAGLRRESPLRVDEALTVAEHVARLTDDEVTFPGGTYEYSNTGHVLLARALELVAGAPFDQLLQADVLAPAQLKSTGFIVGDADVPDLALGRARGIRGWQKPPRARHRGVYPPGGLFSTAADLTRFMRLLRDHKLLSPDSTEALFAPRVELSGGQAASFAGVVLRRNTESYTLVAGSADGGKAVVLESMDVRRRVVILSNVGDVPITDMLRSVVIAIDGGTPKPPPPCRLRDVPFFVSMTGRYDFSGTGLENRIGKDRARFDLLVHDGFAFLAEKDEGAPTLLCESSDRVLTPAYTRNIQLSFEESDGGPVLVVDWEGESFKAKREGLD